jgi:hypothetical protein
MAKQRAPASPDSPTFQQLWEALGSKLVEAAQERLFYTQGVTSSSLVPPTTSPLPDSHIYTFSPGTSRWSSPLPPTSTTPPESLSLTAFTHHSTRDASPLPPTTDSILALIEEISQKRAPAIPSSQLHSLAVFSVY